ncbi:MAG: DNA-deoxyinosine glycosylase [Elusimicrobia bacterium]|nr:DNA-deoxyinosine glycosylase [Elusimicrobiota bacterium]
MPRSFAPVVGRSPRVLMLGSMPSEASLRARRYYAHPRNQFWRLLGAALDEELHGLPYRRRLAALKRRGVALWDVLESCRREGSLDSAISGEKPNPVAELLERSGVKAVFLNGGKADALFRRLIAPRLPQGVRVERLPSSSPAAASIPYARKAARWRRIAAFLRQAGAR